MSRTFRKFKYLFLQAEQSFVLSFLTAIALFLLFEGFMDLKNVFLSEEFFATAAFQLPAIGILMLSLLLGSYYQLLCPFYLSFSTTRKEIFLSMKIFAFIPLLELFLLSYILLLFTEHADKTAVLAAYPGLLGLAFIGFTFGEITGTISLKFVKFGRIFPALIGGIGGTIGGFCTSFWGDADQSITFIGIITEYAKPMLIIGIPLYIIANLWIYRILKKLTAH